MENRKSDDDENFVFRDTSRIFYINNKWYFNTRGGFVHGPYDTRQHAEGELIAFIGDLVKSNNRIEN